MDEETIKIALKIKELEECGELRVVYESNIGANAFVMNNGLNFVIVIDPALSWEQQVRELWHEAKHIYSHMRKHNINREKAELEADEFADKAVSNNIICHLRNKEVILKNERNCKKG